MFSAAGISCGHGITGGGHAHAVGVPLLLLIRGGSSWRAGAGMPA